MDMTITTVMTFFVIRYGWKYPLALCIAGHRLLLRRRHRCSSRPTSLKLLAGGWFPLVIGIGMFTLMLTWMQGRELMATELREDAIDLDELPRGGLRQPAAARARHGGLPGRPRRA